MKLTSYWKEPKWKGRSRVITRFNGLVWVEIKKDYGWDRKWWAEYNVGGDDAK